jgi:hypothetical protein
MTAIFEKSYFVGGAVSNYKDYRKKKFKQQARDLDGILRQLGVSKEQAEIVDFCCATGALIREMKQIGYRNIHGTDISQWAINFGINYYGLKQELQYYNRNILRQTPLDVVLFLDALEHIPEYEIMFLLDIIKAYSLPQYIIVRIPVSAREGLDFVLDISKNDKTHITCHSKPTWKKLFRDYGYKSYSEIKTKSIYDSKGVMCGVFKCQS